MTFSNNVSIITQKGTHQHRGKGEIEKGGGGRRGKKFVVYSQNYGDHTSKQTGRPFDAQV